ncbi:MAG: hypothetical protein JKY93_03210 [Gammaproteobacteria bacterium]|nr:hypothetical protein [Gammaproteobacteria bacterium]
MDLKKVTIIALVLQSINLFFNTIRFGSVILGDVNVSFFSFMGWTTSFFAHIAFCFFLFFFYKSLTPETDTVHDNAPDTKKKREFNWINAFIGMGVAGLFLGMIGKKYVLAGAVNGEAAAAIGLVMLIMVGIVVGYGIKNIAQKKS